MRAESPRPELGKGFLAGLIGGLVASCVMEQFQNAWNAVASRLQRRRIDRGESPQSPEQTSNEDAQSEPATVKAAELISEKLLRRPLPEHAKQAAGEVVHYAFGSALGAAYGVLAEWQPRVTAGRGLPFGAVVWLVGDEIGVPAMGLSKPAREYPLSIHLYALASHLVYGATTEIVRRGVRTA